MKLIPPFFFLFAASASIVFATDIPLDPVRWHLELNAHTKAAIQSVADKNNLIRNAVRFTVDYRDFDQTTGYEPGTVYVKDLTFHNGTIEADLVGPLDPPGRTFVGIAFRLDPDNPKRHELIYFRPFNSGTERRAHTVQYVATDTIYDWPYLRKNFPGVYEASAAIADNVWFHVRLEIDGTTVQVFVNDGPQPVLVVKDLKLGDRAGPVGFWGYPGAFANLKVTGRPAPAAK
ncbi:MAG TPA: hypothetical protein VGM64_21470 [Lacunisphaera sp.]